MIVQDFLKPCISRQGSTGQKRDGEEALGRGGVVIDWSGDAIVKHRTAYSHYLCFLDVVYYYYYYYYRCPTTVECYIFSSGAISFFFTSRHSISELVEQRAPSTVYHVLAHRLNLINSDLQPITPVNSQRARFWVFDVNFWPGSFASL